MQEHEKMHGRKKDLDSQFRWVMLMPQFTFIRMEIFIHQCNEHEKIWQNYKGCLSACAFSILFKHNMRQQDEELNLSQQYTAGSNGKMPVSQADL